MVQTAKSKNTNTSSDEITQEKYNNVVRQLKRERRKIRKINRQRFNNEIRKAAEESVNGSLQNKINKLKDHILELEEDYDIKRYNDRADFKNAICRIATYAFSVCGIWVLRELYFASSCDCEQWE
jgi:hypothetical protein